MITNAYDRGGDAYRDGARKSGNPYPCGAVARALWQHGWEGACLQAKLGSGITARPAPPMTRVAGVLYWMAGLGAGIAFAAWLWGW
jgi:hypothetical protein